MKIHRIVSLVSAIVTTCALSAGMALTAQAAGTNPLQPGAVLYVDPNSTTYEAAAALSGADQANALLLAQYPTATWYTDGTPAEVQAESAALVTAAQAAGQVPVIVAYNLPNRDCGQYSAGGAASVADYEAWIDGLAAGIGNAPAVVILEPDGLGLIPNYVDPGEPSGNCTIAGVDPQDRFTAMNYAVTALKAGANTSVYLDGTHSGWQKIGVNASRLILAGVMNADGFYLNASNYQWTQTSIVYGTWVSDCVALAEAAAVADPTVDPSLWPTQGSNCPNQYWNGGAESNWAGQSMDSMLKWTTTAQTYTAGVNPAPSDGYFIQRSYDNALASAGNPTGPHFVIDTSRNGQGPWDPAAAGFGNKSVGQDWCNPPDRGIGDLPAVDPVATNPLVDAYLWLKVPGESDGQCSRGSADGTDAAWGGIMDPAAGAWFAAQAAQLIELANPALPPVPVVVAGNSEVEIAPSTTTTTGGAARLADGTDGYTFTITVHDELGNLRNGYADDLALTLPAGVTASAITQTGLGEYSVTLTSSTPGNYEVGVLLGDQAIGDPLAVNFIAATIGATQVDAGATMTAEGLGFLPDEQVDVVVHSTTIDLGPITATSAGKVPVSFTVPADFAGAHTVIFKGTVSGTVTVAFTVNAKPAAPAPAALNVSTGGSVSSPALAGMLGLALIAGGVAAASVSVRRREA